MRPYEAMYIVDAEIDEEKLAATIAKYSKVVTDMGGTITNHGKWEQGRRRLAYPIGGRREGMYLMMRFEAGTDVPPELDRIYRISDDAFRHIIVRKDENEAPPILRTSQAATPEAADAEAPAEEAAASEAGAELEAAAEAAPAAEAPAAEAAEAEVEAAPEASPEVVAEAEEAAPAEEPVAAEEAAADEPGVEADATKADKE